MKFLLPQHVYHGRLFLQHEAFSCHVKSIIRSIKPSYYTISKIQRLIIVKSKCHNMENIIKNISATFKANIAIRFKVIIVNSEKSLKKENRKENYHEIVKII